MAGHIDDLLVLSCSGSNSKCITNNKNKPIYDIEDKKTNERASFTEPFQ